MRLAPFFIFLIACLTAPALHAGQTAQSSPESEPERYVKIRLLPERGHIGPGEEMWVAVEQSIYPGWHTYWKNPGDSGAAPTVQWNLPEGFEIGPVQYPVPEKIPYGPLVNYGYSDNVILLQKLKAPENIPEGPLTLSADVEVLVCKEICIPERGYYGMILNGPRDAWEDNSAYLARAVEKLPRETGWRAEYAQRGGEFILKVTLPEKDRPEIDAADLSFFPADWGIIENAAPQKIDLRKNNIIVRQKRGERALDAIDELNGVLVLDKDAQKAVKLSAVPGLAGAFAETLENLPAALKGPDVEKGTATLAVALVFALIGGIILNLMPCVFPVLSIKALSLIKLSEKHPERARLNGLAYTAGVVLSFLAVAGILIAFKAAGSQIGWGFQLQNPAIVGGLAYLLFIIGLNLAGFFEISGHFGNLGNKLAGGEGLLSAFFTGILATIVATPCTAPFMAAALGFALIQPAYVALLIFGVLGFGLALPYLVLSFIPALRTRLPKPGHWMVTFRQFLAFPMFASSAWLIWVLSQQAGPVGVLGALMGLVLIAFGLWLLRLSGGKLWLILLAALSFLLALGTLPAQTVSAVPVTAGAEKPAEFGRAFTPDKLEELLQNGTRPVFVEMTAAWCITCKLNHAAALNIKSTKALFDKNDIAYLVGDWTNQDETITQYLNSFGRNGVPLYVYYGPRDEETGKRPDPVVLPQILTPGTVKNALSAS